MRASPILQTPTVYPCSSSWPSRVRKWVTLTLVAPLALVFCQAWQSMHLLKFLVIW